MSEPCKRCGKRPATVFTRMTNRVEARFPVCGECATNFLHWLLTQNRVSYSEFNNFLHRQEISPRQNWIEGDQAIYCGQTITFFGQEHGQLYFTSPLGAVWLSPDIAARLERRTK